MRSAWKRIALRRDQNPSFPNYAPDPALSFAVLYFHSLLSLQMNLFANFVFDFFESFDRLMLDLLNTLGLDFFHALGNPSSLNQIKHHIAADQNAEQDLADVAKVANQSHDGAREKIADTAQNRNPKETTAERQRQKPQITHARDAVESARRPTQSVNIFRKKDGQRAEAIRHALDARTGHAIEAKLAHGAAEQAAGPISEIVAGEAS